LTVIGQFLTLTASSTTTTTTAHCRLRIKGHGTQKNLSSKTLAISELVNYNQEFKMKRKR